jgi:hypothetical protein
MRVACSTLNRPAARPGQRDAHGPSATARRQQPSRGEALALRPPRSNTLRLLSLSPPSLSHPPALHASRRSAQNLRTVPRGGLPFAARPPRKPLHAASARSAARRPLRPLALPSAGRPPHAALFGGALRAHLPALAAPHSSPSPTPHLSRSLHALASRRGFLPCRRSWRRPAAAARSRSRTAPRRPRSPARLRHTRPRRRRCGRCRARPMRRRHGGARGRRPRRRSRAARRRQPRRRRWQRVHWLEPRRRRSRARWPRVHLRPLPQRHWLLGGPRAARARRAPRRPGTVQSQPQQRRLALKHRQAAWASSWARPGRTPWVSDAPLCRRSPL